MKVVSALVQWSECWGRWRLNEQYPGAGRQAAVASERTVPRAGGQQWCLYEQYPEQAGGSGVCVNSIQIEGAAVASVWVTVPREAGKRTSKQDDSNDDLFRRCETGKDQNLTRTIN